MTNGFLFSSFYLVGLLKPGRILSMTVTNLRNRPLSSTNISSMSRSVLSLYHSFVTGSKDFPLIPVRAHFDSLRLVTPFPRLTQWENTTPSPLTDAPAGVMVPTGGLPPKMLTPVLPERAKLGALRADGRNFVRDMKFDGETLTRVISTVYRSESTELTNSWRVTDYSADGHLLMSVLCQFTGKSARSAKTPRQETEEESSSSRSPPKKRLRL